MSSAVGIALATYNGTKYLPELLSSLERQSHSDFHVHVCDDGSTDGTVDLIKSCSLAVQGKLTVHQAVGGNGALGNFRRTISYCDEPYIALCDQDDVWEPEKLAAMVQAIQSQEGGQHRTPSLVFSDLAIVDADLKTLSPSFFRSSLKNSECRLPQDFLVNNHVPGCAMMFNGSLRNIFEPIPDAARIHDWWIIFIASLYGNIFYLDRSLVKYRQHGNNTIGVPGMEGDGWVKALLKSVRRVRGSTLKSRQVLAALRAHVANQSNAQLNAQGQAFLKEVDAGFFERLRLYRKSVSGESRVLSSLVWCLL